ncbi:hypothetical protein HY572_01750 [Candidatus Micrarchaeota archaeon]|nr:hypothetical protein [Candidatus Micrarchaeota archaeon]
MIVGIVSNRAHRLRPTVLNVLEALQSEGVRAEVVVVDGSGHAAENQMFGDAAAKPYGVGVSILDEKTYLNHQAAEYRFLFEGPYGGPRNAVLLEAVKRQKNVVFLDDDVVPVEPFFTRFAKHLNDHGLVVGAYAGRRTGVSFLMDKASRALTDFREHRISRKEALVKLREAFCGYSDEWPPSVEGYQAGCLAVSWKLALPYAFFPTRFRIEDGVFCSLSKYFSKEEAFQPFLPEAPVGFHKPEKYGLDTLVNYYVDGVQGSCIGLAVEYALKQFGRLPTDEQVTRSCREGPNTLLHEFSPERFALRRQQQKPLDEAVKKLEDSDIEKEYFRFALTSFKDVCLPDLESQVKRFFRVQEKWRELTASLRT